MNILILGGGGREHALAWKIAQSPKLKQLYIAPGNAGTPAAGTNVKLAVDDFEAIGSFCRKNDVAMVVVGPEAPLVKGIVDYFHENETLKNIAVIGPDAAGARLEGSKSYSKQFMKKYGIPTAAHRSFQASEKEAALKFLESLKAPYVLKADGLAAGKGVLIVEDLETARAQLTEMMDGKFGEAGKTVVIEEFLNGREFSVFVLTDGRDYVLLPEAKDYKRVGEGDTGPNTGGMGAVSPVPFADKALMNRVKKEVIAPTLKGIRQENFGYRGFIFFGLMEVNGTPYVIEYNVRLGDPEAEVILPRLQTDLLELLENTASGKLGESQVKFTPESATAVMAVSEGYPGKCEKGKVITGLEDIKEALPFHAGTARDENRETVTSGGRVIAMTALGESYQKALAKSYQAVKAICYDGIYYRTDIGYDL